MGVVEIEVFVQSVALLLRAGNIPRPRNAPAKDTVEVSFVFCRASHDLEPSAHTAVVLSLNWYAFAVLYDNISDSVR